MTRITCAHAARVARCTSDRCAQRSRTYSHSRSKARASLRRIQRRTASDACRIKAARACILAAHLAKAWRLAVRRAACRLVLRMKAAIAAVRRELHASSTAMCFQRTILRCAICSFRRVAATNASHARQAVPTAACIHIAHASLSCKRATLATPHRRMARDSECGTHLATTRPHAR